MNAYYVYAHYKANTDEIFYIGKGKNKRAWHLHSRNRYWKSIVKKYGYSVKILKSNLNEQEAFVLEIDLIKSLKPKANLVPGGKGGGCATFGFKGKHHTKERNDKMSEAMKGKSNRPITQEDIARLRSFVVLKMKLVIDNSTGIKYEGIRVAARALNIAKTTIVKRLKNGKFSYA